ncbi:MAG TPA: hypothetical protein VFF13_00165 [archaeon]|nr:hypothetical protein [archaeon]
MEKTASINIYLFGKPEWEFGEKINPEILKSKGNELKARLHEIGNNLQKLCDNGLEYDLSLYDIMLTKNTSKIAAEKELRKLGINEEVYLPEEEME